MATFGGDDYTTLPDDFLEDEHVVELQSVNDPNNRRIHGPLEPCEGMIFDELEEAEACYKAYARQKGFSIRKNHTRLSRKDKSLVGVEFCCNRGGCHRPSYQKKYTNVQKRSRTMIGCKALLRLKRYEEKWVVTTFSIEHNHELCSPKSALLLPGHRKITRAQKNLIDLLNGSGIPTAKIMAVLRESNGASNVGCDSKDVQNYLGTKRRKLLQNGDAQRMYNYFRKCQSENPEFFYDFEMDEENCMGNCFWADARSRLAFSYFGDVVCFDATYLTNRYGMPFVPFTGVNHHHQSIMFGCALLVNEKTESYVWLLKTWCEAMGGRAPSVIITDDDKAMAKAIAEVFPNTTHRLCMWHILQKVPEHLAHVYNNHPAFQGEFHHCIHDTVTIEEFESEWDELIDKYELRENYWLKDLYIRREKWVPAYLRKMFCAGMSTTQRSESMNKFFKDFVHSSTLVSDFVRQYEKALDKRYQSEKAKDVKTRTTEPILKTCFKIEVEAAKVYARRIFLKFQQELFLSQKFTASLYSEEASRQTYRVLEYGKEKPIYEVVFDGIEKKTICSCHLFEFVGILCRHILRVFDNKSLLHHLPQQHVLQRWTMNAKGSHANETCKNVVHGNNQDSPVLMRNNLMIEFLKVVEEGQKSKRKHDHVALGLQKMHSELLAMGDESDEIENDGDLEIAAQDEGSSQVLPNMEFTLHDPPHVTSRGRPKSLRHKHPKENHVGTKRKCSICKQQGHVRSTCPLLKHPRDNCRGSPSPANLVGSSMEDVIQGSSWTPMDVTQSAYNMPQNFRPSTFMDLVMEGRQKHGGTDIKDGYFSHFDTSCRQDRVNPLNWT